MRPRFAVLSGGAAAPASPPRSQLEIAYEHFRLERQGLVSDNTLVIYLTHHHLDHIGGLPAMRLARQAQGSAAADHRGVPLRMTE